MLVINDLKDELLTFGNNITDPQEALTKFADTVSKYIKDNAEFNFAWTGVAPPAVPDPVVVATGEFTLLQIVLTPSMATEQAPAMTLLSSQIVLGMTSALYNITQTGFATTPSSMSTAPTVASLSISLTGSTRDIIMTSLATQVIAWVKLLVPTAPCSGSHGTFVGSGLVAAIS